MTSSPLSLDQLTPQVSGEDKVKAAKRAAKQLYNFTSLNGMFVLLLAGTKEQNAVAGVTVRRLAEP